MLILLTFAVAYTIINKSQCDKIQMNVSKETNFLPDARRRQEREGVIYAEKRNDRQQPTGRLSGVVLMNETHAT